ncbi:hypothetical protein B0H19DRAFT_1182705 [Mycena capillaripes]|nr:hypothetical protein B0H19DRAFT_1182705 [Mycena capillaripes]
MARRGHQELAPKGTRRVGRDQLAVLRHKIHGTGGAVLATTAIILLNLIHDTPPHVDVYNVRHRLINPASNQRSAGENVCNMVFKVVKEFFAGFDGRLGVVALSAEAFCNVVCKCFGTTENHNLVIGALVCVAGEAVLDVVDRSIYVSDIGACSWHTYDIPVRHSGYVAKGADELWRHGRAHCRNVSEYAQDFNEFFHWFAIRVTC